VNTGTAINWPSFGRELKRRWALEGEALRCFVSYSDDNDVHKNKNNSNTNSNNVPIVIWPSISRFYTLFWRSK